MQALARVASISAYAAGWQAGGAQLQASHLSPPDYAFAARPAGAARPGADAGERQPAGRAVHQESGGQDAGRGARRGEGRLSVDGASRVGAWEAEAHHSRCGKWCSGVQALAPPHETPPHRHCLLCCVQVNSPATHPPTPLTTPLPTPHPPPVQGQKFEYLLNTGNLISRSGLDLSQATGFTVVAEKLNFFRRGGPAGCGVGCRVGGGWVGLRGPLAVGCGPQAPAAEHEGMCMSGEDEGGSSAGLPEWPGAALRAYHIPIDPTEPPCNSMHSESLAPPASALQALRTMPQHASPWRAGGGAVMNGPQWHLGRSGVPLRCRPKQIPIDPTEPRPPACARTLCTPCSAASVGRSSLALACAGPYPLPCRYLSHFRSIHRGAYFAELRTTTGESVRAPGQRLAGALLHGHLHVGSASTHVGLGD